MRGGVVWDLDAVQLPGLNPSTAEHTNIVKPSVLLAEERDHLTVPPVCALPHIPGEQKHTPAVVKHTSFVLALKSHYIVLGSSQKLQWINGHGELPLKDTNRLSFLFSGRKPSTNENALTKQSVMMHKAAVLMK